MKVYRRSVDGFIQWCWSQNVWPWDLEELDDLLVEWKNMGQPPRATYCAALAAMELVFPGSKQALPWARQVGLAWESTHKTVHHKPLPKVLTLVLACVFALLGFSRLGAGLVIQQAKGLRPSELLNIRGGDILLPASQCFGAQNSLVINLGARSGTKSKRSQASVILQDRDPIAYALAIELGASTPASAYVFNGITLPQFQKVFNVAQGALNLSGYSPHSARTGFASDVVVANRDFVSIREEGRWLSDMSLRIYLDVVSTAQQSAANDVKKWESVIRFSSKHFLDILPRWPGCPASPTRLVPHTLHLAVQKLSLIHI